ncbi:hypothetical protein GCM10010218_53070 [Streptomyces mashuensis]|uniref:PPM-type phosphatase domain-containing protein n=1 Tax=Streptomyces mashuensis TaxID=33904 RepID=A0A919B7B9_9ACTN|nr:PP2C family protein-serine/threonine phosphatase [Streptomyces mashuensis]GHF64999.1 hypothetical protein GCM10010218_53070 [Streptomyces mashuensis]
MPDRPPAQPRHPWRARQALIAVPVVLIVLISALDIATGPDIHLGPLLVVAPAVAAAFRGPRATALIAVLAIAAQVVIGVVLGGVGTANHIAQLCTLVVLCVFLVVFRSSYERREQALSRARWIADVAQKVLLRPLPPRIGPLRIAALYVAAEAEARIGGDLYAAVRAPGGTRVLIGDVRGKGLTAVGDAALLLGAFRAAAHRHPPLARLVAHLQNTVFWDATELTSDPEAGEGFVTAAVLDIPDDEPVVRLVSCGHPPPLLLHHGTVTPLEVTDPALPLGVSGHLTEKDYQPETFRYEEGGLLLLYTDGVVETRDEQGAFYPLAERLAQWNDTDPARLVGRVHDDLLAHAGGALDDDVALVAIERRDHRYAPADDRQAVLP